MNEVEREAAVELEEIFDQILFNDAGYDNKGTARLLAKAALQYFRPAMAMALTDDDLDHLAEAQRRIDEIRHDMNREMEITNRARDEARDWRRTANQRRQHPFRNLWEWARGR